MTTKKNETVTPPTDGGTVIVVEPPISEIAQENTEAIAQVSSRIEALETRITEGIEGEREWTTQTITSLRTEVQELKTLLQSTTENLTAATATLRDELILQLQEARAKLEAAQRTEANPQPLPGTLDQQMTQAEPPAVPPDSQPPGGADGPGKTEPTLPQKKAGKRVI